MSQQSLQDGLQNLIKQTYLIQAEYEKLNASYTSLQDMVRNIIDAMPDALWVLNDDGSLFLSNTKASRLNNLFNEISKEDFRSWEENLQAKELNVLNNFYLVHVVKSGNQCIISATDITAQKRSERLISMGQVAAHLAHEIRNPIGSLALLASSLSQHVSPKGQIIAQQMQKAIWRVERIIKATLLFTKGVQICAKKFSFNSIKNDCIEAIEFYEYSKDIKIDLDFGDSEYIGDESLLAMVFDNLIFNAIDAIEESDDESGFIHLWHERSDDELRFYIHDSGVGIDEASAVFEPFKTSKLKGNGLGLALCVQILQAHKGSIEISLNPKTFCVSLPIK